MNKPKFKYNDKVEILEEFYKNTIGTIVDVHENWYLRWYSDNIDVIVYDINIGDRIIQRNVSSLKLYKED
jgi:hypothetical protein